MERQQKQYETIKTIKDNETKRYNTENNKR